MFPTITFMTLQRGARGGVAAPCHEANPETRAECSRLGNARALIGARFCPPQPVASATGVHWPAGSGCPDRARLSLMATAVARSRSDNECRRDRGANPSRLPSGRDRNTRDLDIEAGKRPN